MPKRPPPTRKKITLVISNVTRPITFEWIEESSIGRDFNLSFILMNPGPSPLEENLRNRGAQVHFLPYYGKKDLPFTVRSLLKIFQADKPDLVHTHLLDANLAGLTAARLSKVPRRVHTRHHSDPYHFRHRHALLYDYYINSLSTEIIVASDNVRRVLMDLEAVPAKKISKIPFGIKFENFNSVTSTQIAGMKSKYKLVEKYPIVGMVSRYLEIKGLQYAIPAFKELLKKHPGACLVIANANGSDFKPKVKAFLATLPPDSYREIAFETEMSPLYKAMDVFLHVPIDAVSEAFGQAYTESLAAQLPAVFTLSGVAREFIEDSKNALVVPFKDAKAIEQALLKLIEDPGRAKKIAHQGYQDARRLFDLDAYIGSLHRLYGQEAL